jgi:alpha-galactosidase
MILVVAFFGSIHTLNNNASPKPKLGWSTWCGIGGCGADYCDENIVRSTALAMTTNGMQQRGFTMLMLDDCWAALSRTPNGELTWDANRFPHGMPALAAYVHQLGFEISLYTSVGNTTCSSGGRKGVVPGSEGHYQQDVNTFASWGIDGIIADCCGSCRHENYFLTGAKHVEFSQAVMNATPSREIYLQGDGALAFLIWLTPAYYNSWRACEDHHDNWPSTWETISFLGSEEKIDLYGKPNAWPFMDVLMTGVVVR